MSNAESLQRRVIQIEAQIAQLRSERQGLEQNLQAKKTEFNGLRGALAQAQPGSAQQATILNQRNELSSEVNLLEARLSDIDAQLATLETELARTQAQLSDASISPVVSAGQNISEQQSARDNGSNTQLPEPAPLVNRDGATVVATTPEPSTATRTFADEDAGTDDNVRTYNTTQSIPPPTARTPASEASTLPGPGVTDVDQDTPTAPYSAGVGADSDDAANPADAESSDVINLVRKTEVYVTPQANVLDKAASYTYSISIYLMSPEDYDRLLTRKQKILPGYQLLMQSAGAPVDSGLVPRDEEAQNAIAAGGVSLSQGRNQFFPLDYYLDDVQFLCLMPGKGTGTAHNVSQLKFRITEPNGITLLDNLYKAVQQYVTVGGGASKNTQNQNYAAQNYLMVIRFYGWDAQGNLVRPQGATASGIQATDPNAIVEKFIPFQFTTIKFRVANRLVEYECEAVTPQNTIGTSQGRGTVPYNIELTATTLQKLFNGNEAYGQPTSNTPQGRENTAAQSAPNNANTAPTKTANLVEGLTQALNRYQKELKDQGIYDVPDVYKISISHPELANASVVPPGPTNRKNTPSVQATSAAQAKDGDRQSVQNNAKTVSVTAGTQITQFLDLAVRSSDYIFKQQKKIIDKDGKEVPQGNPAQSFAWYRIGVQARPLEYDQKRNDYAYEITYEIAPYGINQMKSDYFPNGKFRGAHKEYYYWFTGQNNSVLSYEQDFNYLYQLTINSRGTRSTNDANVGDVERRIEVEKKTFSPNSPQSNQGTEGNALEPGANAADFLYSRSDQSRVKLSIIGDPAWIWQGEMWSGVRGAATVTQNNTGSTTSVDPYFDPFLDDGTINFDAREALFRLGFNKPKDYDLQTGLIDLAPQDSATPLQDFIYKAIQVTSTFSKGRFTQELEGLLLTFPDEVAKIQNNQQAQAADENESPAERARLSRINSEAEGRTGGTTVEQTYSTGVTPEGLNPEFQAFAPALLGSNAPDLASTDAPTVAPQRPTQAPTSSGQIIGPDSSSRIDIASLGGASGARVGIPSASLALNNGSAVTVYSQAEIQTYLNTGQTSFRNASAATNSLTVRQQAAQSPTTEAAAQSMARDD